ncbi:MAG: M61 family metallopeptidase [Crocinitomicaceae bacterium]|nr:PDZ domain-containing protein [Flavobacteriales bacterium]NQZ36937.1 M61 family metallopeptidase [Crocinitomicaceae bacterium]
MKQILSLKENYKFMLKYWTSILVASITFLGFGQEVNYKLKMERPQNHYFQVEMTVNDVDQEEVIVKMPVWSPGSYLVREFSKNLDLVKAVDEKGKSLEVKKISKNAWKITKAKGADFTVKYEVYAFELTVRTSFLDLTHGFVSGPSVFMYVDGLKSKSGNLEVFPYKTFSKITTALPRAGESVARDGSQSFIYADYDQLVDCPLEIGNQIEFDFDAAGVKHHVGIYGSGNFSVKDLQKDMARIVEAATDVFGQNPNKDYTFIIHNVTNGQGGLEHVNSTTLSVNRFTFSGNEYRNFLSLVAHEYFHLWNVKRIRPVELGPFDYDHENYTSLLWVMEGFTSYYDELLLLRAGYYTKDEYLKKLFSSLNYVEGSPGARVQPVAHASFDAWIKAYRPNENSRNTTISYYSKGAVIAAILDSKIITKYKGKKSLDDFMQHIYKTYFVEKNRGFSEDEFKQELEDFLKEDLTEFYAKYINGTEMPDYKTIFAAIGLTVEYIGHPVPSVGISLRESGGKVTVSRIRRGSSAEDGGLSVNDEIIGCNGLRVNKKSLEKFFASVNVGSELDLLVARDQELYSVTIGVSPYEQPKFSYELSNEKKTQKLNDFWLRTLAK